MKIGDFSSEQIQALAASKEGICFDVGVFTVSLRANNTNFLRTFHSLYTDFKVVDGNDFIDFHIRLIPSAGFRRWLRPQIRIRLEGEEPFQPFAADHAMPLFEWGLNWCIARQGQQNLMLHAAVLEKKGKALILPALPGSGKSTLAAALANRGWRFLSDEFCIIRPQDGHILPIPRPTPLKNASIDIIRSFAPQVFIGPLFDKTRKGTIGHLRSPRESVMRMKQTALPHSVVFPRFQADVALTLNLLDNKASAFLKLATNAFNYDVQGEVGFKLVKEIINRCDCYSLLFSNLDDAITELNRLVDE